MNKTELMQSVAGAFKCEPTTREVADSLGITVGTVTKWPDVCGRRVLKGVVGDIVRRGVKVPAELVKALKESK